MADGPENQTLTDDAEPAVAEPGPEGTSEAEQQDASVAAQVEPAADTADAGAADEVAGAEGVAAAGSTVDEAADGVADEADGDSDHDEANDDEAGDDEADDDGPENPLEIEGEVAADYLEELLDIADLDGDIDTYVENGRAQVSVLTDSEVLVGADGEVLEALQELSRLAVLTETGDRSRLMLDIGGYRERRRKALTEMASDAVQEVKDSGEAVRLEPMNPFERKIVHDVVAAAGLTSESEGEEPQRRVVIQPGT